MMKLGGLPDGWSSVAPRLLVRWPFYKRFPPVWVKLEPATEADIEALGRAQGGYLSYDKLSIVGKGSEDYTTLKREYLGL